MKLKTLLMTAIVSATVSAGAQTQSNVKSAIEAMASDPYFFNAQIGVLAIDINTGATIAEYNPDMSLTPASNMKLFSTAAALEMYGPEYTFDTKLAYTGSIDKNGRLRGNLFIIGGGLCIFSSIVVYYVVIQCFCCQFCMQLTRFSIHSRAVIVKNSIGHIR